MRGHYVDSALTFSCDHAPDPTGMPAGLASSLHKDGSPRRSVFYFFERGPEYIRCEWRPAPKGHAIDLLISEPDQPERVEHFGDVHAALARWREIKRHFTFDGWSGPLGRE